MNPSTTAIASKKLLTVAEAAQVLGISRSLTYKLVLREELPSVKIGRARRIPAHVLDRYIAGLLPPSDVSLN